MTHDAAALAISFLHWLHEREVQHDHPDAVRQFGHAYQALTQFARDADSAAQNSLLHTLSAAFSMQQSNWEFGSLANTCGAIVEWGGDPGIAIEPILDRITEQFAKVPELVQIMHDKLGVAEPNHVAEADWQKIGREHLDEAWVIGEWYALQFIGCASMAMLVRDREARNRARERIDLMQRAETARKMNPYAYYLAELLASVDDQRLLVLDVPRRLGFRVTLTAVRNNFHLFTLLQDALLAHPTARDWQGPRSHPLAVAVAKSERMLPDISPNEWGPDGEGDAAIWTYYTEAALKPDGSLRTLKEKSLGEVPSWVWGEGKPTEIPLVAGERVILLGPLEMPRSWNVGFFAPLHPSLRSAVVVEAVLSDEEYAASIGNIHKRGVLLHVYEK
jgi:hypothetical protein